MWINPFDFSISILFSTLSLSLYLRSKYNAIDLTKYSCNILYDSILGYTSCFNPFSFVSLLKLVKSISLKYFSTYGVIYGCENSWNILFIFDLNLKLFSSLPILSTR